MVNTQTGPLMGCRLIQIMDKSANLQGVEMIYPGSAFLEKIIDRNDSHRIISTQFQYITGDPHE